MAPRPGKIKHITTCISIDAAVRDEAKKLGLNLSEFINQAFYSKYLSTKAKQHEIETLRARIDELQQEIDSYTISLVEGVTERERQEIMTIPDRLAAGANKEGILRGFNTKFGRDLSMDELDTLVTYFHPSRQ
jgi:Na+/phosphate symporter